VQVFNGNECCEAVAEEISGQRRSVAGSRFFNGGKKRVNIAALGPRLQALDMMFKLRGSYAPRHPAEAAQFGTKVVVDIPRRPKMIDAETGGNGEPPSDNNGQA
jgi:hypothetical protein